MWPSLMALAAIFEIDEGIWCRVRSIQSEETDARENKNEKMKCCVLAAVTMAIGRARLCGRQWPAIQQAKGMSDGYDFSHSR